MNTGTKFLAITAVIVLAFLLQAVLILMEKRETPAKAAVEFAKAYYMRDPSMAERLCGELRDGSDGDVVTGYINRVTDEAAARGFGPSWKQMCLGHIKTDTRMTGDDTAEVTIEASMRRSINPIYAVVARIFFLGETYHLEKTLHLIKEDQRWKVCGEPFALTNG